MAKIIGVTVGTPQKPEKIIEKAKIDDEINAALRKAKESGEFDGDDGKTAYQYAKDGGYTGTEKEFTQKLAKELPTKLSDLENDLELEVEGTVEITDGEPTKESTVMTIDPNADEVNICTEEDFNAFKEEIDAKFDAFINAEEVSY